MTPDAAAPAVTTRTTSGAGAEAQPSGLALVAAWFGRIALPVWFGLISLSWLYVVLGNGAAFAHDQYLAVTRAWLDGADPYAVNYLGWFAAPPITLLLLVPFAVLPGGQGLLLAASIAGGVATVRMLRLPWWWLTFPPLFIAMIGGGFDAWLVPLILGRVGWLAVIAKAYAAVPLALTGQWRQLVIAAAVTAVTFPFLPWPEYLGSFATISDRLASQAVGLSAPLVLAPVVVVLLVLMGRQRAAWMAVPALWPSTQHYYSTLAMPALTPAAAALLAWPSPWTVLAASCVLAIQARRLPRLDRAEGQDERLRGHGDLQRA